MPVYTSRPQIVHRKTLAIEGQRVKGISRSTKDLRSRSSERSLARRGLKRSRSEGANVDKSRKHPTISRKAKKQPRRAYSRSPSRAIRRRHHSHEEIAHRKIQRNLGSAGLSAKGSAKERSPSARYARGPRSVRSARDGPPWTSREMSLKHLSMEGERSQKNRNEPQNSSRNRSRNYSVNPVTNSEKLNLKSSLKNKNNESEKREIIHRDSRSQAKRGSDLRHSANMQQYTESSEESQEEEEYEEEYEEDCEERSDERSASWYDRRGSIRIRRDIREEYFRMMEELFILSGDGIRGKKFFHSFLLRRIGRELEKEFGFGSQHKNIKEWIITLVAQTNLASCISHSLLCLFSGMYLPSYTEIPPTLHSGISQLTFMCLSTFTDIPPNLHWVPSNLYWGTSQVLLMCLHWSASQNTLGCLPTYIITLPTI